MLQRPAFAKRIFFNPFNIGELDFLKVHATSECSIGQGLKVTGKNDLVETVTFKDTSSQLGYGIWQGRRLQIVTTGERTTIYSGNSVRDLNRMQVLKPKDHPPDDGYAFGYSNVFCMEPEFQWLTTIFKFPVALYGHHLTA